MNNLLKTTVLVGIGWILLVSCGDQTAVPPENERTESQEQEFILIADRYEIQQGECTVFRWEVIGGYSVMFYDEELPLFGEREICPQETQILVLRADMGTEIAERTIEIHVHPGSEPADDGQEEGTSPAEGDHQPVEISPGQSAYQAGGWQVTSGPPGGLGYDIRMHPQNHDVMYVTDAWAGAFKSLDGGKNWFPINNGITTRTGPSGDGIPVFSLTIDPNNPDTLWVGTQFAGTVFRSDDGGQNWRSMSSGILESSLTIRGFSVEPGNSDVVYLAGEISSWEWNNGIALPGIGLDKTKGAVYKTTNGGEQWTRIWVGDNLARYIMINPENPDNLFVSTGIFDREAANSDLGTRDPGGVGILRSFDGGSTWEVLGVNHGFRDTELQFGSLFMHPENPDILIAAAGNDSFLFGLNEQLGAIYLTEDGGDSWERVLELDNASCVEICSSDPNVVYAGSISGIHRSDDGGHTWQETMGFLWGTDDILAGFPIDMLCDPTDPMRIFVNNYIGGNFLSEDGGVNWELSSNGYTGAMVKQVDVSMTDPKLVYNASRMGVFVSDDGGDNWTGTAYSPARAPEGIVIAVDPFDDKHILALFEDAGPDPWASWDGGQSWEHARTGFYVPGGEIIGSVTEILFSKDEPGIVLATLGNSGCKLSAVRCEDEPGFGIIHSTDRGISWSATNLSEGHVVDLTFYDQSLAYAAAYPDLIYRSDDGGKNWVVAAKNIMPEVVTTSDADLDLISRPSILSLAIDPFNSQRLLAGFKDGGVKRSNDGGQTWETMAAGLVPEISVNVLLADPMHQGVFYLGSTNFGFYYSTDSGETWTGLNTGLSNRNVTDLVLSGDGSVLYAATDGGGVFRLGQTDE